MLNYININYVSRFHSNVHSTYFLTFTALKIICPNRCDHLIHNLQSIFHLEFDIFWFLARLGSAWHWLTRPSWTSLIAQIVYLLPGQTVLDRVLKSAIYCFNVRSTRGIYNSLFIITKQRTFHLRQFHIMKVISTFKIKNITFDLHFSKAQQKYDSASFAIPSVLTSIVTLKKTQHIFTLKPLFYKLYNALPGLTK